MSIEKSRWDMDADVIVIGYGAAGAVAAMTAHDAGAQVLVLEKQAAQKLITNSYMSGGGFICPSDAREAQRYMEALCKVGEGLYWTEPDIIRVWAQYASENKRWFDSTCGAGLRLNRQGGEHKLPGSESIEVYSLPDRGPGLMRMLYEQMNTRNIRVVYDMAATELLTNSIGEVAGVKVGQDSDEKRAVNVQARRAVILTTGGFEFDEQMKLQYLKIYPTYFLGSPANTGDGIKMALGVGAQLWHMNCCPGRFVMKFPEVPTGLDPLLGGKRWHYHGGASVAGYIIVDRYGKRCTSELYKGHSLYYEFALFDSQKLIYPRIPSYWIFDQKRMDDGPLVRQSSGPTGPSRIYDWSSNNSVELGRGWIKRGDTIKDLARTLNMESRTLTETIDNYNAYCRNGVDAEFGRLSDTLIPLTTPPYYVVEVWPGAPNTQGGPRRNGKAQVLRPNGSPIPRLYSAGELGSIYGMLYPGGGGNLAECIAFGRVAGENASGQKPF